MQLKGASLANAAFLRLSKPKTPRPSVLLKQKPTPAKPDNSQGTP